METRHAEGKAVIKDDEEIFDFRFKSATGNGGSQGQRGIPSQ